MGLFREFDADDLSAFAGRLRREHYRAGDVVFRERTPGTEMFVVANGMASAYLAQSDGRDIRLATFPAGTAFGELVLLDRGERSASVVADTDLTCFVLHRDEFEKLCAETPAVAIKLLTGLGCELSDRLRRANTAIHQLSE
jgi:glutaminase